MQLSDVTLSAAHKCFVRTVKINPRELTVLEFKKMLAEKGESLVVVENFFVKGWKIF